MLKMKQAFVAASLMIVSLSAMAAVSDQVTVNDAFVREVPAGQNISAAFMTVHNEDMSDHKIVRASSPVAKSVELHTHSHENGMMKMRQIPEINIPAGDDAYLKPGGLHVMLIGLQETLSPAKPVSITLTFEDGSEKKLSLPVKAVGPAK